MLNVILQKSFTVQFLLYFLLPLVKLLRLKLAQGFMNLSSGVKYESFVLFFFVFKYDIIYLKQ